MHTEKSTHAKFVYPLSLQGELCLTNMCVVSGISAWVACTETDSWLIQSLNQRFPSHHPVPLG